VAQAVTTVSRWAAVTAAAEILYTSSVARERNPLAGPDFGQTCP
jgi:hypothetical protein